MRRLKTYLRSTMLSSLALLQIYRYDFPVDLYKVISEFVSRKEQRLSFLFWLSYEENPLNWLKQTVDVVFVENIINIDF